MKIVKNNLYPVKFRPTKIPDGFILIVDTGEQMPLFLDKDLPKDLIIIRDNLRPYGGDYSVRGFEDKVIIERKRMSDFLAYIGRERKNTIRKLELMRDKFFAALIIETDNPYNIPIDIPSQITPEVIRGALTSIEVRYGIHIYCSKDRIKLERYVLDCLVKSFLILREN